MTSQSSVINKETFYFQYTNFYILAQFARCSLNIINFLIIVSYSGDQNLQKKHYSFYLYLWGQKLITFYYPHSAKLECQKSVINFCLQKYSVFLVNFDLLNTKKIIYNFVMFGEHFAN